VLLATYNGEKWLEAQIDSILHQNNVVISIIASDDGSIDGSVSILKKYSASNSVICLPQSDIRFGSAARNFYRLIRDAELGNTAYVAFCDQDDLWFPNKIHRAIKLLEASNAEAYSSNVEAFWEDGRRVIINKAQPQRACDHIFSSPGPGCTFVIRREAFDALRAWAVNRFDDLCGVASHDWVIYAFYRCNGYKWIIDHHPTMAYRQHASNEIGANIGIMSRLNRLSFALNGKYLRIVLDIISILGIKSPTVDRIRRFKIADRLWLSCRVLDYRRNRFEALVLILIFMFSLKPRGIQSPIAPLVDVNHKQ
jgi:rhamnosyltransferase